MTDCFMPMEKNIGVTREAIKALNERDVHYLIVTKSALVADDDYIGVMDKRLAHIQITVTTLDDDSCRQYEKASVPTERVAAVKRLQDAGFDVTIRLSPYMPEFFSDADIDHLRGLKIKKALVEFLRINSWIEKWFSVDTSLYTLKHGGYKHLPLQKKIRAIDRLRGVFEEITVCEDETEAYEYWKVNFNPNKNDCCNLRM